MSYISDQNYLKDEQYKTPAKLEARIALHRRFGVNPIPWHRWVFDQMALETGPAPRRLLEVGCGPGSLWRGNLDRVPSGWRFYLGDLSAGMAQEARSATQCHPAFTHLALDAQAIPFPNGSFAVVAANHMLYHIPDLEVGLREIARVLGPGGRLFAALNGLDHMRELYEWIRVFEPGYDPLRRGLDRITLENAPRILKEYFSEVEVRIYKDNLNVTEVEPLLAYVLSMWGVFSSPRDEQAIQFERYLREQFASQSSLRITKSQGLVMAKMR